ncbi:class I SAM-dependent methyltransferase [Nonomuraea sp. CA-218870]|uniref:class I SAM-dependent methyltransferase n=1 Tax=Nonomuraea sp. CA-218870 TaxID=3239998 RepID=UPI003D9405F2
MAATEWIDRWDDGCQSDERRNELVLPYLAGKIRDRNPRTVLDIGCGSGYISRILSRTFADWVIDWILLDDKPDCVRYAVRGVELPARAREIVTDFREPLSSAIGADLAFVVFSLLEFPFTKQVAENLADCVTAGGDLVIVLPDVLEDLMAAQYQEINLLEQYVKGISCLQKQDKFTGTPYNFFAPRVEEVIAMLTCPAFSLESLSFYGRAGKRILILDFVRRPAPLVTEHVR